MKSKQLALGIDLIGAVDTKIDKVRTRSLDVSFNELLDMYDNEELKIDPEFQRLFRWNEAKQSQFIESLILEMPVPPIYVIELETNKYELIDGLQRISSYLHFRGENKQVNEKEGGGKPTFLVLEDCDIVSELNNHTYKSLPPALQIKLKRNFIRMEILRKESDARLRYYLFKRLNTGGELLSEQEIRNCTVRLLGEPGEDFNKFIIDLSQYESFTKCIANLSDDKLERKQDQEFVLRFFAFKNDRPNYIHDVGTFMTEFMEKVAMQQIAFNYLQEETVFKRTFDLLTKTLGGKAFSGFGPTGKPNSKLLSYHYEAFTLGLQPFLNKIDPEKREHILKLEKVLEGVKRDPEFIALTTGGGKNYAKPLSKRLKKVEDAVASAI
jgi:hypothetical protein